MPRIMTPKLACAQRFGRYFGYPECCIETFLDELSEQGRNARRLPDGQVRDGVVFCPACATRPHEEVDAEIATRRRHHEPFPTSTISPDMLETFIPSARRTSAATTEPSTRRSAPSTSKPTSSRADTRRDRTEAGSVSRRRHCRAHRARDPYELVTAYAFRGLRIPEQARSSTPRAQLLAGGERMARGRMGTRRPCQARRLTFFRR